jgi:Na+/H+ antiporter NhaC
MKKWLFILFLIINQFAFAQDSVSVDSARITGVEVTTTAEEGSAFRIESGTIYFTYQEEERAIPAWLTILPPLIAILMALLFKEVISALFIGIFSGVMLLMGFTFQNIFIAFLTVLDTYIVGAINDSSHISVIVFSILIGGMVAIISRNGGMKGIVNSLSKYADTPVMGQLITWFLGIIIFFDDYANTLVVGNTMRPVTDKLRISREKLSYIVDSTAAPVAAIAFITTWIGAELGFIQHAIEVVNSDPETININETAYSVFLNSLQFSFYPILTLIFILMLIYSRRDFGPMLQAEKRARDTGAVVKSTDERGDREVDDAMKALDPVSGIEFKPMNALLPVLTLVFTVIAGLFLTGHEAEIWNDETSSFGRKLSTTFGNADSYKALIWASTAGVVIAVILTISQRIMTVTKTFETMIDGFKTMVPAITILVLAWALGKITEDIHTAGFLSHILSDKINPYWIAELTFLLAAVTAFSTGTSWGTMTILFPIVLPLTWSIGHQAGLPEDEIYRIFYNVVSVVLAGAVFGDHCSPISDTTILSSMASACPHIDHVKTQLPYAITVAVISMLVCTKMADFGLSWYLTYPTGILMLYLVIRFLGKKINTEPT